MSSSFRFMMVSSGPDGSSHFQPVELPLTAGPASAPPYAVSDVLDPNRMVFTTFPADFDMDWHPAPRRQFILILEGGLEISTTQHQPRVFRPGDVVFVADTTGRGHLSRPVENRPCTFASVALTSDSKNDWLPGTH